ncbi:SusC/RagA family TonB-linked outer membrane protein [Puteibacter caeruleilacunae]|nr:SusC/RagA family TonB-linked outer membrane protein [Puteibacter caeruleilacunae]
MKKKLDSVVTTRNALYVRQILMRMKLTICIFLLTLIQLTAAESYSQSSRLTLNKSNVSLKQVLQEVESMSDYFFIYSSKIINAERIVDINVRNKSINQVLDELFQGTTVKYVIKDNQVLLSGDDSSLLDTIEGAQQNIRGKVVDSDGNPIPGVAVVVKGTSDGTVTDLDGNYSLQFEGTDIVLTYSFVGMLTKEVIVDKQTEINVTMTDDVVGLEEVVVVGYGTQMRTKVTGAISQIDNEELEITKRPVTSIQTALVGSLPGVRSTHSNGKPGSTPGFSIRGASSTNSTGVLVIIDGFEGSLNDIDPNSIENISVLKDASAVAVYGARGANGVMLVTTKATNKNDRLSLNYSYNHSIQTPQTLPKTVNSLQYMQIMNEAQINDGLDPENVAYSQDLLDLAASGFYPETIWPEEMYDSDAGQQSHNLTVSGGTGNTGYLINTSYLKQNGLVIGADDFKRLNLRIKLDTEINDWLSLGTNVLLANRVTNSTPSDGGNNLRGLPFFPVKTDEGEWVYKGGGGGINSIASAASGTYSKQQRDALNVQLYAKVSPLKGLTIEERVSYQNANTNTRAWNNVFDYVILDETDPEYKEYVPGSGDKRSLKLTSSKGYTIKTLTTLNYDFDIQKHHGHVLLGFQSEDGESESFQTGRKGYELDILQDLDLGQSIHDGIGGGIGNTSSRGGNSTTLSYFGRLNYDYASRYVAELSFRVDGSSNFSKGNQWGFFPAASVGWNISQEPFFDNIQFVDRLKLRASYGLTGDDSGVGKRTLQLVNFDVTGYPIGGEIQPRLSLGSPASQDLKWETAAIMNFGLDFSLWDGKLQMQGEYFINNRQDILDNLETPKEFGLGNVPGNVYDVKSWGWELELKHRNKIGNFGYWMSFNISSYDNKITDLKDRGPFKTGSNYQDEGLPINNRYGYQTDGFFDSQEEIDSNLADDGTTLIDQGPVGGSFVGGFKFVDQPTVDSNGDGVLDTGDGVINTDDRVILDKNSNANYYTGFSLGASYKGFSISARFYGVLDKKEWWTSINTTQLFPNSLAPFELQTDYWRTDNKDALFPLAEVNVAPYPKNNSHFLHNSAFIKIKNVTMSYSFSKSQLNAIQFIKGLDVVASVENLGTVWTNNVANDTGWDPELGTGTVDYPLPITYSFGVNVKF